MRYRVVQGRRQDNGESSAFILVYLVVQLNELKNFSSAVRLFLFITEGFFIFSETFHKISMLYIRQKLEIL